MANEADQGPTSSGYYDKLKSSEARLRRAERIANFGHWELDLKTQKLDASQGARRIYELSDSGEYDYSKIKAFTLPQYRAEIDKRMRRLLEEGGRYENIVKIKTPETGTVKDLFVEAVYDAEEGKVFGIIQDITERKNIEARLEQSEQHYHSFFEKNSVPVLMFDPASGEILEANKAACNFYGYDRHTLQQMNLTDIDTRSMEQIEHKVAKSQEQDKSFYEFRHRLADDSIRDVRIFSTDITIDGREVLYSLIFDETDRKQAEKERDKLIGDIGERYKELNLLYRVARYGAEADITLDELARKTVNTIPTGMQYPRYACARIVLDGKTYTSPEFQPSPLKLESRIQTNERQFGTIEVFYGPDDSTPEDNPFLKEEHELMDTLGRLLGNISHRKHTEKQLTEERRLLRTVIDNLPDAIYAKDEKGRKLVANQADLKNIGKPESEVLGKTDAELFPKDVSDISMKEDEWVLKQGKPIHGKEQYFHNENGDKLCLLTSKIPLRDKEGHTYGLVGIGRDITQQIKNEQKLRKSLEEKKVLLAEVHHRVKNNLAIISGLLGLQMENWPNAKDVLIDAQNRIHSIAGVHELLYNNDNFIQIDLRQYLANLSDTITQSYSEEHNEVIISTNIDDVQMNVNQAIPFGLLINELINNSFKHAFESGKNGKICLDIFEKEGIIHVKYTDNGKGLDVEERMETSLGFELIRTLARQLDAYDIEMYGEEGFQYGFKFKPRDFESKGSALSRPV